VTVTFSDLDDDDDGSVVPPHLATPDAAGDPGTGDVADEP
jgi:hypothetical protein